MVLVSVKTHPVTLTLEASVETWKDGYGDLHATVHGLESHPALEAQAALQGLLEARPKHQRKAHAPYLAARCIAPHIYVETWRAA